MAVKDLCYNCQNVYYDALSNGYCRVTGKCVINDYGCICSGCSCFSSFDENDYIVTDSENIDFSEEYYFPD